MLYVYQLFLLSLFSFTFFIYFQKVLYIDHLLFQITRSITFRWEPLRRSRLFYKGVSKWMSERVRERCISTYKCNNAKNSGKQVGGEGKVWVRRRCKLKYSISKSFSFPRVRSICALYACAGVGHLHVHLKHPKVLNMVSPSHDLEELCQS